VAEEIGPQTFLFADMAGFTALTEAHGDDEAADLAGQFFEEIGELASACDAQVVKTIGDAVLVRVPQPDDALELAVRIVSDIGARHGAPTVRIGMHTGTAVERGGDWFGGTLNLAARISSIAAGGDILLSEATRQAAGELSGITLRTRGEHRFKNIADPIKLFAALSAEGQAPGEVEIDPVCRMAISPGSEAGRLVHEGTEYHFCSLDCVRAFAEAPERFIDPANH
jgi:adenylate cyclase